MFDLRADSERRIHVRITGNLAGARHKAVVDDIYPGGKRIYVRDPGTAEVFIAETVDDDTGTVPPGLVPWSTEVTIADPFHDRVTIYVNGTRELEIKVKHREDEGKPGHNT
jgi:hypothetical protein